MRNKFIAFLILLFVVINSYAQSPSNLLGTSVWSTSLGAVNTVGSFSSNGGSGQNSIIWDTDPFAKKSLIWKSVSDGNNGPNGGWNLGSIPINANKAYRSTVWIKRGNASGSGVLYFGCDETNTLNLDNSANNNPYFTALPNSYFAVGKWYLWVGYIHASNDGDNTSYGGIYDGETGQKVFSLIDFKIKSGATVQTHRTYDFYDTQVGSIAYWYGPRFEEINGSEPSVEQLLGTVGQAATNNKRVFFGGNVGIGTGTPIDGLQVTPVSANWTGLTIGSSIYAPALSFMRDFNDATYNAGIGWSNIVTKDNQGTQLAAIMVDRNGTSAGVKGSMHFYTGGTNETMYLKSDGNVGIGTISPSEKLSVNGNIRSKKLIVTQTGWSDYVFDTSYQLKPLTEVEQFIKTNKHLPDIPSAKEVEKEGIDVGDNQALLLKKIEELTLYIIETNKKMEQMKKTFQDQIIELKKQNQSLVTPTKLP